MENRSAARSPRAQDRPLLDLLPTPMRRASGVVALTLTLWLVSFLALIR
jgi:hypothetical protein